jgi:hypothetical protein
MRMIKVQHIKRKRLVYSLDELAIGTVVDWRKPVALIGDGESKCRFIFNREKVTVFALNRAARVYPADMMVSGEGHGASLESIVPVYIPFVTIQKQDVEKYKLISGANGVAFLSFLVQWVEKGPIILQGFNFSNSDQPNYDWRAQINGIRACWTTAKGRSIEIFTTNYNAELGFLTVKKPNKDLYL